MTVPACHRSAASVSTVRPGGGAGARDPSPVAEQARVISDRGVPA